MHDRKRTQMNEQDYQSEIRNRLSCMSAPEKDQWILKQASLVSGRQREDFLLSLTGEKEILEMPMQEEIQEFFHKVKTGEIFLAYMTKYEEFDSEGHYKDDWESQFNDPSGIMPFLELLFECCHKLNKLGSYTHSYELLTAMFNLEIEIKDDANTQDTYQEDDPFTVADVFDRDLINVNQLDLAMDWFISYFEIRENTDDHQKAAEVLQMIVNPVCEVILPSAIVRQCGNRAVFQEVKELLDPILASDIKKEQRIDKNNDWKAKWELRKKLDREKALSEDIQNQINNGMAGISKEEGNRQSFVITAWNEIKEKANWLKYERYIDDQIELEEIENGCEAIAEYCRKNKVSWKIRKKMIQEIIENGSFAWTTLEYVFEEMLDSLSSGREEEIEKADLLMQERNTVYRDKAAQIYRMYNCDDKYLVYLKGLSFRYEDTYLKLMEFYNEHGCTDELILTARKMLKVSRGSKIIQAFLYLLKDAVQKENEEEIKNLMKRAGNRKYIDRDILKKAVEKMRKTEGLNADKSKETS